MARGRRTWSGAVRTSLPSPLAGALLLALALGVAPSSVALAQGSTADIVFLPNGGRVRGLIELYEPGVRVVILLPDGTRRTLVPGEFERVQFGDETPPEAEPTPPVAAPPQVIEQTAPEAVPESVPDAAQLQRIEAAVGVPGSRLAPSYGDGLGADLPWNAVDPLTTRLEAPEGWAHLYLQLGGFLAAMTTEPAIGLLGLELSGGADLRVPGTPVRFRVGAVVGAQTHEARSAPRDVSATGAGYLGARASVSVDCTSWLTARAGGEWGAELLPAVSSTRIYGGPLLELAFRLLDDRRLELGLGAMVQDRSGAFQAYYTGGLREGSGWSPRLEVFVGGILL